ncbi:MAG: cytochrome c [Hyphomicrobiales bacterium]|nr:cytochrome c [Hyphomicrobiales bacterium]
MKKFLTISILAGVAFAAGAATAQNDPIAQRKSIMKGVGDATKPVAGMLKGTEPFDNALVQKALATYIDAAKKMPSLFPADSKHGGETTARSNIWDEKPRFDGLFARLGQEAAAAQGAIKDQDSLKPNFGKVLGVCKECHDDYREKKN